MSRLWLKVFVFVVLGLAMTTGVALAQDATPVRPMLSDMTMWGIIVGFATSVVTAILNRAHWPSWVKLFGFFVMSLVTSAGNAYFNGDLNSDSWVRSFLVIFSAGIGFYLATKPAMKEIEAKTG